MSRNRRAGAGGVACSPGRSLVVAKRRGGWSTNTQHPRLAQPLRVYCRLSCGATCHPYSSEMLPVSDWSRPGPVLACPRLIVSYPSGVCVFVCFLSVILSCIVRNAKEIFIPVYIFSVSSLTHFDNHPGSFLSSSRRHRPTSENCQSLSRSFLTVILALPRL